MTHTAGSSSSWSELLTNGLLTRREAQELASDEHLLKIVCTHLHLLAGCRQDVLVFDPQMQPIRSFGYCSIAVKHTSGQLMRRYCWATKTVARLNTVMLQNIEAWLFPNELGIMRRIDDRFVERQGMPGTANVDLYRREPTAVLEAFPLYGQVRGTKELTASTMCVLYDARTLVGARWHKGPANYALLLSVLQQLQGITYVLRLMNQTSVLGRYLVSFRHTIGQMQHDLFHIYIID